jgi:hypothetical protein
MTNLRSPKLEVVDFGQCSFFLGAFIRFELHFWERICCYN